jgi:hypothetical protein
MDHRGQVEAGRCPRHRHRQHAVGVVALEQDVEPAPRTKGGGRRRHGVTEGRRLRPVRGGRLRAEERLQAQRLGRLAAQEPRRRQVFEAELVHRRRRRGRAEHEVDPVGWQVLARDRRTAPHPQDVRRAHPPQVVVVGREAGGAALATQRGDRGAHVPERGLEEPPHVDLALVARSRLAHVATGDAQGGDPPRVAVQPAGREEAGCQGKAEDREQGRVAHLRLDLAGDGLEGIQVARRVEAKDLVHKVAPAIEDREPLAQLRDMGTLAHVRGRRLQRRIRMDRGPISPLGSSSAGWRIGLRLRWRRRATRLAERRDLVLRPRSGEPHRCGRQVVVRVRIGSCLRPAYRPRRIDAQLGQVRLLDGSHALGRPAHADVTARAAVDLTSRRVVVARPDVLLPNDGAAAGGAVRGVQLLDVLAERDIHPPRAAELAEGRIERAGLGCQEEGLRGKLREGAGVGGHRAHPVRDSAAGSPARPCPRIEDGVARRGERGQLRVKQVVGGRREVALQERETGEAARKDDVVQAPPFGGLGHGLLRFFEQVFLELGL